jgi:hypothetical protein
MSQNMYFTNYCRVLEMTQYPLHYVRFIKMIIIYQTNIQGRLQISQF